MKTILKPIILLLIIITAFCFNEIMAQTYGSGALINSGNCSVTGTLGGCTNTFIGDGAASNNNANGTANTALGYRTLYSNLSSGCNIAIGDSALYSQAYNPGSGWGGFNVAVGNAALFFNNSSSLTTGVKNTAVGYKSLYRNTVGFFNTANGFKALYSNTSGQDNTAIGYEALYYNTGASYNTAVGSNALLKNTSNNNTATGFLALGNNTSGTNNNADGAWTLANNSTGSGNTANGYHALALNTSGAYNTACGFESLYSNTIGYYNTAIGTSALFNNTTAYENVAIGYNALANQSWSNSGNAYYTYNVAIGTKSLYNNNPTSTNNGVCNTASGYETLKNNSTGAGNTAVGFRALFSNTTAGEDIVTSTTYGNTAMGFKSLYSNTTGSGNVANGSRSLSNNTTGGDNVAIGTIAMQGNTLGAGNCALGYQALGSNTTGSNNTSVGYSTMVNNTSGNNNTALGRSAGVSASNYSNATAIGYGASAQGDNYIRAGNTSITDPWVQVDWFSTSDIRVKNNIKQNVPGLNFIKLLRPVTYHLNIHQQNELVGYPQLYDTLGNSIGIDTSYWPGKYAIENIQYTGFIAQQVDSVAQSMGYDFSGISKPTEPNGLYGLRYSTFVAPLVNAIKELSLIVDSLKKQQKLNDSVQLALINNLQNHQQATDNLLYSLINCCNQNPTNKTMQVGSEMHVDSIKSDNIALANNAVLYQNAPNPFGEGTTIKYFIPDNSEAQIIFYDEFGSQLKRFDIIAKGMGEIRIDASNLSAGMYSYSLVVNNKIIDTKKMLKL
jgi:hypothetical protein